VVASNCAPPPKKFLATPLPPPQKNPAATPHLADLLLLMLLLLLLLLARLAATDMESGICGPPPRPGLKEPVAQDTGLLLAVLWIQFVWIFTTAGIPSPGEGEGIYIRKMKTKIPESNIF